MTKVKLSTAEKILASMVIVLLITAGFLAIRRFTNNKQDLTSPQAITALNEQDSAYGQAPIEHEPLTIQEVAPLADSSPVLKKVKAPNDQCDEGLYELLSEQGEVIGCLTGLE